MPHTITLTTPVDTNTVDTAGSLTLRAPSGIDLSTFRSLTDQLKRVFPDDTIAQLIGTTRDNHNLWVHFIFLVSPGAQLPLFDQTTLPSDVIQSIFANCVTNQACEKLATMLTQSDIRLYIEDQPIAWDVEPLSKPQTTEQAKAGGIESSTDTPSPRPDEGHRPTTGDPHGLSQVEPEEPIGPTTTLPLGTGPEWDPPRREAQINRLLGVTKLGESIIEYKYGTKFRKITIEAIESTQEAFSVQAQVFRGETVDLREKKLKNSKAISDELASRLRAKFSDDKSS